MDDKRGRLKEMIRNAEEELKSRGVEVHVKSNNTNIVLKWKQAFHAIAFVIYASQLPHERELTEETNLSYQLRRNSLQDLSFPFARSDSDSSMNSPGWI